MFKKGKSVSDELNDLKTSTQNSAGNDPLQFFLGIVLLGAGLFMLSKRVMIHNSWHIWRIGSFDLSSGTVVIPLIIGIILYFANPKSVIPKIFITLGVIFMAAAGSGLLLKTVFRKKD